MKYPKPKIDVLKCLNNVNRPLALGEINVEIGNIQRTIGALKRDGAVVEFCERYTITQLGKEIIQAFRVIDANKQHKWNKGNLCLVCGLVKYAEGVYIRDGKKVHEAGLCLKPC